MVTGERKTDSVSVVKYVERGEVLSSMREGGMRKDEIEKVAGVSSSTAHRILSRYIKDGIAERKEPGVYALTPTGEEVAREVEMFRDGVSNIKKLSTVIESADRHGVEFDPEPFKRGVVATSTSEHPYEPGRRCLEVFRETDELRLLVVSTATPRFWKEKQSLVAEGRETEIICPEDIVETSLDTISRDTVEGLIRNMDIRVHDDPPFSITLFDERIGVGGHADDGKLEVFADTDDAEAYEWGERVYERYREESDAMFDRFDADEVFDRLNFEMEEIFA
jgi:predicted transcriptional regulator